MSANAARATPSGTKTAARTADSAVLAVLVVRNGEPWLRRCLASLGRQRYRRLGVVAVDNGSTDASWRILVEALGRDRVLRLERNVGFPAAVGRALMLPGADQADYILVVHDDTVLAPGAVTGLVAAAERGEEVGIVGPKVLDSEDPRVLREIGLATDRFGFPYSPLEEDEIDQGQYDIRRGVLFVSSVAMLVSRDAWQRAGSFDERLWSCHADLDFCWRVRLCGFQIVVDPTAVALHRGASGRGERPDWPAVRDRYLRERAGLMTLLKNYRLLTLAWVLPLYLAQGVARMATYLLSRRFADAGQIVAAWGWNLAHLPGTLSRRVRGHAARRVSDREVVRYMAPATSRLRRWVQQASSVLVGSRTGPLEPGEEEEERVALRERVAGALRAHPLAVGWTLAMALSLLAFREVLFGASLEGGALPRFPVRATTLFQEFASGWRSSGFGGAGGASPALVPLGAASTLAFGSPRLLARLLVAGGPILAAVSCYRAVMRGTTERLAGVAAAACYGLSAITLWAASEGRISGIVFLAILPWLAIRLLEGFGRPPERPVPWIVGTGMGLAIGASFFPAIWIVVALLVPAVFLLPDSGSAPVRGLALAGGAVAAGFVLILPFAVTLVRAAGGAAVEASGSPTISWILRLSPGPAPGAWPPALFLPLAGVLAMALSDDRRGAWRAALLASACFVLAWLSAAGLLWPPLSNPLAYLGLAAFLLSLLVGLAIASLRAGLESGFGGRQLAFAGLALIVGGGLMLQSAQALGGGWAVGERREPPGWAVVETADPGVPSRVLWLGRPGADAFPPPGGAPLGEVAAGRASVRYALTGKSGASVLGIGVPVTGPGFRQLERALEAVLQRRVRHAGSLLAAMGIHHVVSGEDDLPAETLQALREQVDLDMIQRAGGLMVFRTSSSRPLAGVASGPEQRLAARSDRLLAPLDVPPRIDALERVRPGLWAENVGIASEGVAIVAVDYDARWRLRGRGLQEALPFRAFGWGVGFDLPSGRRRLEVAFEAGRERAIELVVLTGLWAGALWVTRRRPQ